LVEKIIRSGTLEVHSHIPSEEALANIFQLSRPVIRNALKALTDFAPFWRHACAFHVPATISG